MSARQELKRVAHRVLGDDGYAGLESRYWRRRLRRLDYPYEYEEEIASVVSSGDTVLDVGANVGQYSVLLSRQVGPEGRVLAFEPVPRTFRLLESVVSGLQLPNVHAFRLALADFDGTASIAEVDNHGVPDRGLAHLACDRAERSVVAPVARLDSIAEEPLGIDGCSFVKIDVEGAELLVLRGAEQLLATRRPAILVEVDRGMSARYGTAPEELHTFLAALGYEPATARAKASSHRQPAVPSVLFRA
jgi:FkbM family methyltransferase